MLKRWQRIKARSPQPRPGVTRSNGQQGHDQTILRPIWQALNIATDNKALLLARAGSIINANQLFLQLSQRGLAELVDRPVAALFDRTEAHERWETLLATASRERIAVEVTRQDLGPDLGEFEVYAIRDLRGRQQALESQERQSKALQQREEELRRQNEKLDAALDNMLQGLAMFDADQRLIVCNRRYREMYGLTADQVKAGTTLRQIFDYRLANGFYHVKDSESLVGSWTSGFGNASARIQELADGRIISVVRRQMANGGRIVTHEDITERQRLNAQLQQQHQYLQRQEERLRAQNVQLDVALNNMSPGLCLFDVQQRVVIANSRYADMYGLSVELLREGTTLQQILEARAKAGLYDDDAARQWARDGLVNAHKEAADVACSTRHRSIERTVRDRWPSSHHRHERGHNLGPIRWLAVGTTDQERGFGPLSRQGRRARHLPLLRSGNGRRDAGATCSRARSAQRVVGRRARTALSTRHQHR